MSHHSVRTIGVQAAFCIPAPSNEASLVGTYEVLWCLLRIAHDLI